MDGVELLREKRGGQSATFDEVADHMTDFLRRRPEMRDAVHAFARFLAGVEGIEHRHERAGDGTL